MSIPAAVDERVGQPATVRVGTVVSVDPLQVSVQGSVFDDLGLIGEPPAVGATVVLLGQSVLGAASSGSSWLVLGGPMPAEAAATTVSSGIYSPPINTTSAVYGPVVSHGVAFRVPASGKVLCHFRTSHFAPAGSTALTSVRLGEGAVVGAGTLIQAPLDDVAISGSANEFGTTVWFPNLTPGLEYNVEFAHRSSGGGNCFWSRREVIISPVF